MQLIISMLVHNQVEVTKKCIASIILKSSSEFKLIILDNASDEKNQKELKRFIGKLRNIEYIRSDTNLGFIGGHNKIYKETKSKYFCVINNDVIIHTVGWDSKFIDYLETTKDLAQIGAKQELGFISKDGTGRPNMGRPMDYISGHCFIVNRYSVDYVGGLFEDKYMKFAFCEDADLSLRLRNRGFKIGIVEDINIGHLHNQTFKNEKIDIDFKRLERENREFLMDRWGKYLKERNFSPMKILVMRDGAIGDTFCAEPIVQELTYKYPKCEIYFQTSCGQVFKNHPHIVEIGRNLKNRPIVFDKIIDLNMAYEKDPLKHIIDAYALTSGVILNKGDRLPTYYGFESHELEDIEVETALNKQHGYVVAVNSEGSWASRTWNLDLWKQFITYLKEEKGYHIIELGANPKSYLGVGDNYVGKLTLKESLSLLYTVDELISFDGALMHFAQSFDVPTFTIFGCICPNFRIHNWKIARVVWIDQTKLYCAGCHHLADEPRVFTECPRNKIYCLENITLDMVIDKYEHGDFNKPTLEVIHNFKKKDN